MAAQVVGGGSGAGPRGSGRRWPTKYFTVSEVGEMISDDPSGANWALLPDNQGGYDVFDVRALFKRNPDLDTETALESTELGRAIVSQELRTALDANGDKPLGKLLTWKHPEVVSEHDGRDGRDLWCTIGNVVYDITGFPFSSGKEEEALIDLAFGKKTAGDALDDLDVNDLVTRLGPYKCGFLRPTTGVPPSGRREFTLRELGRHIYPQIGMYCALDGDVYDLGRYLHSHPGGAQILHQYAGRDATDEFRHAHADWVQTLRNHSDLVVGRMVDEITDVSHMEEGELVLLGRVFDFSSFGVNEQKLFDELTPYTGTDATHALKAEDPPDALLELLKRDDLVCAKLVTGARRLITLAEFRRLNHIPSKAERQKSPGAGDTNWRVWVAVAEKDGSKKQMVYDVTLMMMFGGLEFEQKLRPWVGKEVRDPELAHVLRTKHESFVIGELRVEESKADRVSARRAQVLSDRDRYGGQRLAGSKRHAGALNDSDLEVMEPRSKRVGAWR
ncbi:uncharacterized protein B0H64DRAFT_400579 [Chaetomium fimeti]|uniref:Cytochrome b5 heme-binding domain-containing protein n=1 Tax=Chaetomium fimeti TaxID=1854472 RepID=A0AAE0HD87_9PEZI|nr:hypothetical protein B0H64DRAFT_400579 [Chaetomium fimeti]